MNTLENNNISFSALATDVKVNDEFLTVSLEDGRVISTPVVYFPSLINASQKQKDNWRLIGKGQGICWEDIDEDLSVEGLLRTN